LNHGTPQRTSLSVSFVLGWIHVCLISCSISFSCLLGCSWSPFYHGPLSLNWSAAIPTCVAKTNPRWASFVLSGLLFSCCSFKSSDVWLVIFIISRSKGKEINVLLPNSSSSSRLLLQQSKIPNDDSNNTSQRTRQNTGRAYRRLAADHLRGRHERTQQRKRVIVFTFHVTFKRRGGGGFQPDEEPRRTHRRV